MTLADALALGRVSNLPTVWTNMVAGVVLCGGDLLHPGVTALFAALTLFYVGGMYLNDYFDAAVDAIERPERPIPAGRVSATMVGGAGFSMLGLGLVLTAIAAISAGTFPWPVIAGAGLAGCIVLYDWHHKANPLSPIVMGGCRMLVYVCAGLVVAVPLPPALWLSAVVLLCYLIGLTYVAKQENLGEVKNLWPLLFLAVPFANALRLAPGVPLVWPFLAVFAAWVLFALRFVVRRGPGDIPRAVVSLIAGISLLDAVLVAGAGAHVLALVCVGGFALTLLAQRYVSGT